MGSRSPMKRDNFDGKSPTLKYRHFLPWVVQKRLNRSICRLGCGLGVGRRKLSVAFARWRQCAQLQSYSAGGASVPNDTLPWAVQKWLDRLICRLGCGLGWAEGSTSLIVFARRRQCAHTGGHIGATWWIRLNRPSAPAIRSYVKLIWPLVVNCY